MQPLSCVPPHLTPEAAPPGLALWEPKPGYDLSRVDVKCVDGARVYRCHALRRFLFHMTDPQRQCTVATAAGRDSVFHDYSYALNRLGDCLWCGQGCPARDFPLDGDPKWIESEDMVRYGLVSKRKREGEEGARKRVATGEEAKDEEKEKEAAAKAEKESAAKAEKEAAAQKEKDKQAAAKAEEKAAAKAEKAAAKAEKESAAKAEKESPAKAKEKAQKEKARKKQAAAQAAQAAEEAAAAEAAVREAEEEANIRALASSSEVSEPVERHPDSFPSQTAGKHYNYAIARKRDSDTWRAIEAYQAACIFNTFGVRPVG